MAAGKHKDTVDTDTLPREVDAVVIGAGPAGSALAASLSDRGFVTILASPVWAWPATYGVWCDEVHDLPYDVPYRAIWDEGHVQFGGGASRILSHSYGVIDNPRLLGAFRARVGARGVLVTDRVLRVVGAPPVFSVEFGRHGTVSSRLVFDATGHAAPFLHRPMGNPAFQTALGFRVHGDVLAAPAGSRAMGLMLWDNGLELEVAGRLIPAFIYTLPQNDETSFIEYTVLAARPMIAPEELREPFVRWLGERGMKRLEEDRDEERVVIPMGHELPDLNQPVVGIGGAASQVHPATGYLVSRALHTAERLADRVADAPAADPRILWDAVWPAPDRKAAALYRMGLEAVLAMNPPETRDFFEAFFELPDPAWRGYLWRTASPAELSHTMWTLFRQLPNPLQRRLAATALGPGRPHLWRAFAHGP